MKQPINVFSKSKRHNVIAMDGVFKNSVQDCMYYVIHFNIYDFVGLYVDY